MSSRTAILLGASGLVGSFVLKRLLLDPAYEKVIALIRRPLPETHPKLESIPVDFAVLNNSAHLIKGDDIFCCLGTTIRNAGSEKAFFEVDFTFPFNAARMAKDNGVRNMLIITSIGARPDSGIFYSRVKGQIEEALKTLNFQSLQIFRPSFLIGRRQEKRFGERIAIWVFRLAGFLLAGRWKKYRPIKADSVASAMVEMAHHERNGVTVYESDVIQMIANEISVRK